MKTNKPTTPSRRHMTGINYRDFLTASEPHKSLTKGGKRGVGRNAFGRITTRHKGGGHKRRYREIDFKYNKQGIMKALMFGGIMAIYFYMLRSTGFVSMQYITLFALPVAFALVFLALEKGIKKEFFLKKIKLEEMDEDEVIAFEFMSKKEQEKFDAIKKVIEKKEIEELNKKGVKELLVFRDLPRFGPFILIGVLLALAFPNLVFL